MASRVNSRVARRMLVLFVLAALIPLAALALVTFYKVRTDLVDEVGGALRGNAKSIAMDFHLRLDLASEQMDLMKRALSKEGTRGLDRLVGNSLRRFSHIWIVDHGTTAVVKGGTKADLPTIPYKSGISLRLVPGKSDSGTRIYMAEGFDIRGSDYQINAELDPARLWEGLRGSGQLACLTRTDGLTVYCNDAPPHGLLAFLSRDYRTSQSGFFLRDGYLTAYWSLFEGTIRGAPVFIAMAATPEQVALKGTRNFESIFAQVVGLTLLLIAFVSIRAIRSSMDPLEKLLAATRMLSNGNFASRVELDTGDEFEELGGSFNMMADRLGRQFDLQGGLSRLGQQLQEAATIEETINLIFAATSRIVDCGAMLVTYVVTEGGETTAHVYSKTDRSEILHADADESGFAGLPKEMIIAAGADLLDSHAVFKGHVDWARQYCLIPGVREGRVIAALVFEMQSSTYIEESVQVVLMQVGVLLASSLTNVFLSRTLYYQAHHDHLTGLPNRLFISRLVEEEMQPASGRSLVVSIFDIDRFKLINDTQGHAAGDELLKQVGQRLRRNLGAGVVPSRFAGDEFIVVSLQDSERLEVNEVVEKLVEPIQRVFSEPFQIGNSTLNVEASLGLARFPQDGEEFVTLLKNADAAMYEAKRHRQGGFCFYSDELKNQLAQRLDLEVALNSALEDGEFELYYQPIVDLSTTGVVGAETLIRWNRPGHGMVMPDVFIKIAEETGMIVPIGSWVLLEACRACKRWLDNGIEVETIAVNVASQQLDRGDFVEVVRRSLDVSGLPARYLELEVTETSLVDDVEVTIETLQNLRSLGVRIAVDDFGTGYSSLQYLKRLPVDKLKVDQSFVRGLPADESDIAIVKTLVALARELELMVLAEGCETESQAQFLLAESITQVQGWLFSAAVREADFLLYVSRQRAMSAVAQAD